MVRNSVPVISVVGWSNSGKTTVLVNLVAELKSRGYMVGVIKHHHGPFEIDKPGKDTWRLFRAGAKCTAIAGPGKVGLVIEAEREMEPGEIAGLMPGVELVFTEGYKRGPFPQIEVRRTDYYQGEAASRPGQLIAVVGDDIYREDNLPFFNNEDIVGLANFIIDKYLQGE